ncbi:MAG: hypothetical protein ACRDJ4_13490 [Actinomycetota bacterium]
MTPDGEDPYADVVERARVLAAEKRARGEIPPNTSEVLDRLFLEIAPPGARSEGEGLEALVEMLSRYSFDPAIPIDSSRPGLAPVMRAVKRLLRPLAAWQLRYLTDQLNAYHAAQNQVLRALLRGAAGEEAKRQEGGS